MRGQRFNLVWGFILLSVASKLYTVLGQLRLKMALKLSTTEKCKIFMVDVL